MYTVDTALVYDLFPQTLSPEFQNPYEGRDNEVSNYVLITNDERYIFVEGTPEPEMKYYGRALVGDGEGEYTEFNAYTVGNAKINVPTDVNHLVDIVNDQQLEFEFDELFRKAEEQHRVNRILEEADVESKVCCQGCDCEEPCQYVDNVVIDAIYETRSLLKELEQVLEYHVDKKNGDANALLVPTISEAAADHLYNRISNLHDHLAGSLNQ